MLKLEFPVSQERRGKAGEHRNRDTHDLPQSCLPSGPLESLPHGFKDTLELTVGCILPTMALSGN